MISHTELAERINAHGLEYVLLDDIDPDQIRDQEIRRLWKQARAAIKVIYQSIYKKKWLP